MFDLAADDMEIYVKIEYPAYLEWKFGPEAVKSLKMPVQVIYAEKTVEMSKETVEVIGQLNGEAAMVQIPGKLRTFSPSHIQRLWLKPSPIFRCATRKSRTRLHAPDVRCEIEQHR